MVFSYGLRPRAREERIGILQFFPAPLGVTPQPRQSVSGEAAMQAASRPPHDSGLALRTCLMLGDG